jgi:hypothetical protein
MHQTLAPQIEAARPPTHADPRDQDPGFSLVRTRILETDREFLYARRSDQGQPAATFRDVLISTDDEPLDYTEAFNGLRWGGQLVVVSHDRRMMAELPGRLINRGFTILRGPAFVRTGWGLPLVSPRTHYLVARKTLLIPPREFSDRFTYHVELERSGNAQSDGSADKATDHWVVRKQVPSFERVLTRLQFKAPEIPLPVLQRRAQKFVEQIFPLFLTREAAMLKVIERDCPKDFAARFPRVVHAEKDEKGYVQQLWTTWLRNTNKPISQLEFARQGAELLHLLHERIGIIHLDLRMDNMVITDAGVGFVDFGSAVRVGENIQGNAVLSTLFGELMRTSQIQRMMDRMTTAGALTSTVIRDAYQRVDKAVDLFYLAVQINQPVANPDLRDLVQYDKYSPEAMELARMTEEILRPSDPSRPRFRTANDVLQEVLRIEARLKAVTGARVVITSPPDYKPPQPPAAESSKPKVWIWES